MIALQWQDKRLITMLTTIHDNKMVSKKRSRFGNDHAEDIEKPLCIEEHNKHMGGVDRSDQLLSYYGQIDSLGIIFLPNYLYMLVARNRKENKRKTTTYYCKDCHVSLCVTPCFKLYHTRKHPQH